MAGIPPSTSPCRLTPAGLPSLGPTSNIKYQISNIKYQISNIKYQISNIKYQISNIKDGTPRLARLPLLCPFGAEGGLAVGQGARKVSAVGGRGKQTLYGVRFGKRVR